MSTARCAAVQRGKAMLVSRFSGVQHAHRRAALRCAGNAPQCSIGSEFKTFIDGSATHGADMCVHHGADMCVYIDIQHMSDTLFDIDSTLIRH